MTSNRRNFLLIILVGILAWFPTLNFWFFKAYEATWLTGLVPHNLINLIRGHGILYFLDLKIFGWNPWGWYLTSLILHIVASVLLFKVVLLISKNKVLSLVSSLIFVASTSYNDVLTWGSFNSYYPLLLICMLCSLGTFIKFKETKNKSFFFISMAFAFGGFFIRETGILIVPIISAFDIIFSKNLKNKKTISEIIKRQVPFYLLVALFFFASSLYGGTPGDSADSNVKLQIRFVNDKLYLEYARASILTFGKLIPPQIVPYEFINFLRELTSRFMPLPLVNTYFFPLLGWLIFGIMGAILFFIKKSKNLFKIFLFFWSWIGLFSLFVSLAVPSTPEVLERAYDYNTMRYRYFAFVGTSVVLAVFLSYIIKKTKTLYIIIVFLFVVFNLVLIWKIERDVYISSYKPAKEFNVKFISYFPKLPTKTVFYLYPHAPALSDYILEWFTIKGSSYSNLAGQPFRVESQIIAVLDKVKKKKIELNNVIFLDYSKQRGLLNETDTVKKILLNQKTYDLKVKHTGDNVFESNPFDGPFIEIPYNLKVSMSVSEREFVGKSPDSARFRSLVDYSIDRNKYLKSAKISTAYTMSQRAGEPFFHVLPSNLIDGNIGPRSSWIADDWAPWVEVDLGKDVQVAALYWGSTGGGTRVPATYTVLASKDKKTWQIIKEVKNFNGGSAIDIFNKSVSARYIRMEIKTTSGGDFVLLDEFEVISSNGEAALSYYKDRNELFYASTNLFQFVESKDDLNYMRDKGLDTYFAKLSWTTNKSTGSDNAQYLYFPYKINTSNQNVTIEIPESEIYSGSGNFLNKHFTSVSIDFASIPFTIFLDSIQFVPRMRL